MVGFTAVSNLHKYSSSFSVNAGSIKSSSHHFKHCTDFDDLASRYTIEIARITIIAHLL